MLYRRMYFSPNKFARSVRFNFNNGRIATNPIYIDGSIGGKIAQTIRNKAVFIYFYGTHYMWTMPPNNICPGINGTMREGLGITPVLANINFIFPKKFIMDNVE